MDVKPPLKVARSGSHEPFFSFDTESHISRTAEARVAKFCVQVEYIMC